MNSARRFQGPAVVLQHTRDFANFQRGRIAGKCFATPNAANNGQPRKRSDRRNGKLRLRLSG